MDAPPPSQRAASLDQIHTVLSTMEGIVEEDAAARAYAKITSHLNDWASPKVGTVPLTSRIENDGFEEDEDVEIMNWARGDSMDLTLTPQKRPSGGTSTPIMSNSSKKQQRGPSPLEFTGDTGDDDQIMDMDQDAIGVQSPWFQRTSPMRTVSNSDDYHEFRRYHDALFTYLVARRNLSERMRIQEEEGKLALLDPQALQRLDKEEERVELDLLGALSALCLDRMDDERSLREGNFWSLAAMLRLEGMECLLYPDGPTDQMQHQQQIDNSLQNLAMHTNKTPAELIDDLQDRGPLVLRRRKLLLGWMEQCQELLLPQVTLPSKRQSVMWKASLDRLQRGAGKQPGKIESLHPDEPLLFLEGTQSSFSITPSDPLYGNDEQEDASLLKACFSLILAGKVDKALDLCQKCGQPWRAAAWAGGSPHGVERTPNAETQMMDRVEHGNPHRALWKRTCWKLSGALSNKMAATGSSVHFEAAIYAILSNDMNNALSNPALTTWEHRMQAVFGSIVGRTEDDLLYRHNDNRRRVGQRFPFPGTEHEREEREQLQSTAFLGHLTEANVFESIASYSPMEADDPLRAAQAAFIIGKSAVSQYVVDEGAQLDDTDVARAPHLRFLTHLTLYLDSLSASTTSTTLPGLEPIKNDILFRYVCHLASRSDLWRMLALYASLLPTDTLLECYPEFLSRVEGDTERQGMLKDARELFPKGLDLVILKRVVNNLLSEKDGGSRFDERKMKAVLWLCYYEDHMGDAVIFSNTLLRHFLLDDTKLQSAFVFLDKFLPSHVVETVMRQTEEESQSDGDHVMRDAASMAVVKNAYAEHGALECYLEAEKAFDWWKSVVTDTAIAATDMDKHNLDALTANEADIAISMERRDVVRYKRHASQAVVEAADSAREKLMSVIEYPGGFLCQDEDDTGDDTGDSEHRRSYEMVSLRRRCLPRVVFLLHNVYHDTAAWMARLLDDGIPKVGKSQLTVLAALDSTKGEESSPLAPAYWLKKAMALGETVASEDHEIYGAFEASEMDRFMDTMAETAVKFLGSKSQVDGSSVFTSQEVVEIDDDEL